MRACLSPQIASDRDGIDARILPPPRLIAPAMKLSMMLAAQRHGEFIAHLSSECPWLGKAQMMGVRRFSTTDDASLCGHEFAMLLVAEAMWLERDRAVCGVRSSLGNLGRRAYLIFRLEYLVAGCRLLLLHHQSVHFNLERVFDDTGVLRREHVLGGKVLAGPGDGGVG